MAVDKQCLEIALHAQLSQIKASDGKQIAFTRAILEIRNTCDREVSIAPHANLGQEGGTVQDVSTALASASSTSIPPLGSVSWDVFDVLLPAHQGSASKIHMFGYRAVLNWRFELSAWADYLIFGSSETTKTPAGQWSFKWSVSDAATGAVGLDIEEIKG